MHMWGIVKRGLWSLVIIAIATQLSFGQKQATPATTKTVIDEVPIKNKADLITFYKQKYKIAKELRDKDAAKDAIFSLFILSPADTAVQMDLMTFYFETKQYNQSAFLADRLYTLDNKNIAALDILTKSQESVGEYTDAVINYETLYQRTKNSYYQYLSAFCQYELRRYYECDAYMQNVIKNPDLEQHVVVIAYEQNGEEKAQEVPLKAAVLNLYGLLKIELKQYKEAKAYFEEAMKRFPDFILAQRNYEDAAKLGQ